MSKPAIESMPVKFASSGGRNTTPSAGGGGALAGAKLGMGGTDKETKGGALGGDRVSVREELTEAMH